MTPRLSIECTTKPFEDYLQNGGGIDFRLDEDRWKILKKGDVIEYWEDFSGWDKSPAPNARKILCIIDDFIRVSSFQELIEKGQSLGFFGNDNPDDIVSSLRKYWNEDQESKIGVLGLKIKVI